MRNLLLFFLVSFITQVVCAQNTFSYNRAWRQVHHHELLDLPRSANAEVDTIYLNAKKEKNNPQLLKALIYKSKFLLNLEEKSQEKIVALFKNEIDAADTSTKHFLESMLANIYWQYYQKNRWQLLNRSRANTKNDTAAFTTWDATRIFHEIHVLYQRSLGDAAITQLVPLSEYEDLLIEHVDSKKFRPTLFDFLAHNALNLYSRPDSNLPQPLNPFQINEAKSFGLFFSVEVNTPDSLSFLATALGIYNSLLKFHREDEEPSALVNIELDRLDFLKANAILEGKEEHYRAALVSLMDTYSTLDVAAQVGYKIAAHDNDLSSSYSPGSNENVRFKRREALAICNEIISKFEGSLGAQQCAVLRDIILEKEALITSEKYLSIDQPSRILIRYKNLDSLYLFLYKASHEVISEINQTRSDSLKLARLGKLRPVKSWSTTLKNEQDYHQHSTEVLIPSLMPGAYFLAVSPDSVLRRGVGIHAFGSFQVTDIAIAENNAMGGEARFFHVLNRKNGSPLSGASIHLKNRNTSDYNIPLDRMVSSDEDGIARLNITNNHQQVIAKVAYEGDTATFGDYYFYKRNGGMNNQELVRVTAKTFLFTDRSIYRPGQKVYFKGILIQKKGTDSNVVPNEFVEVYLDDVNGEEIGFLRLKTNEFGSFSGYFDLPPNGITGEYNLYVEEDYEEDSKFYDDIIDEFEYSDLYISVEEYKRPTFEVKFDPIEGTYRLKDSVSVSAKALSYAGASLSNADVTFRVRRTVQYPRWYPWDRQINSYSPAQEISFGKLKANEKGEFEIQFLAVADPKVGRKSIFLDYVLLFKMGVHLD
ncbi:MAG: MG2 domain-containing protein [Cytophagales bacterium]|nr:MG2 domain-containing protein [Cytophagales bacterium]